MGIFANFHFIFYSGIFIRLKEGLKNKAWIALNFIKPCYSEKGAQ